VVVPYDVAIILLEKYAICYSCFNLHVAEVVAAIVQCCCNNIYIHDVSAIFSLLICFKVFQLLHPMLQLLSPFICCNIYAHGVSTYYCKILRSLGDAPRR